MIQSLLLALLFVASANAQAPISNIGGYNPPNECNGACTTNADVTYLIAHNHVYNINVEAFANVLGRKSSTDPAKGYPGVVDATTRIDNLKRDHFITLGFNVPMDIDKGLVQELSYSDQNPKGQIVTALVTTIRGGHPLGGACVVSRSPGQPFFNIVIAPNTNGCQLIPGNFYSLEFHLVNDSQKPIVTLAVSQHLTTQSGLVGVKKK